MHLPSSRHSRHAPRNRLAAELSAQVALCSGDTLHARVFDEGPNGLGMLVSDEDARLAARHEPCCVRGTVHVTVLAPGLEARPLACQLVHLTSLLCDRAVAGAAEVMRLGVRFATAQLAAADIDTVLAIWRRLEEMRRRRA